MAYLEPQEFFHRPFPRKEKETVKPFYHPRRIISPRARVSRSFNGVQRYNGRRVAPSLMGRRSRVSNNTIHGAMIHNRIAEQPTEAKCLRVRFSVARMRVRCGYALEIREEHRAWMLSRTRVKMFAQVHPRTGMQPRCNKGRIMEGHNDGAEGRILIELHVYRST